MAEHRDGLSVSIVVVGKDRDANGWVNALAEFHHIKTRVRRDFDGGEDAFVIDHSARCDLDVAVTEDCLYFGTAEAGRGISAHDSGSLGAAADKVPTAP